MCVIPCWPSGTALKRSHASSANLVTGDPPPSYVLMDARSQASARHRHHGQAERERAQHSIYEPVRDKQTNEEMWQGAECTLTGLSVSQLDVAACIYNSWAGNLGPHTLCSFIN